MFAISGLAVTLFLGAGGGPGVEALPWLKVIWFLAKVCILIGVMIWLRGTLPRLRVDQLMGFAGSSSAAVHPEYFHRWVRLARQESQ